LNLEVLFQSQCQFAQCDVLASLLKEFVSFGIHRFALFGPFGTAWFVTA